MIRGIPSFKDGDKGASMITKDAPYKVVSPHGTLMAFSVEDARAITIWPDSIIIRTEDGAWVDRPLCLDQRERLEKIHGIS